MYTLPERQFPGLPAPSLPAHMPCPPQHSMSQPMINPLFGAQSASGALHLSVCGYHISDLVQQHSCKHTGQHKLGVTYKGGPSLVLKAIQQ